ncbi:MAG: glycosyltransferase family 2 protein [Candidatus Binatia bacterium]
MATAVLDLDFDNLPLEITGLERYQQALILIRLRGRPVGQALLPVLAGRAGGSDLRHSIMCAADSAFWEQWLRDYLDGPGKTEAHPPAAPATIAVCTRDRPEDLSRCLNALAALPDDGQQIIVVDNCPSTDETRRVVRHHSGVRYIREDRPGLDVARNRALREARHPIVAFSDDDALPDPSWLRALLRNFDDPLVMCATGLTMPSELETEAQEWFQRLGGLGRGFKRSVFDAARHNPLDAWEAGAGVNMALRRGVLDIVGPFDEALDVGSPVGGGGDTDMFRRILVAGYRIVYDPEALNWHRHRRTWKELQRQLYGYESAGFAVWTRSILFERDLEPLKQAWKWFWRELSGLGSSLLGRPGSVPPELMLARMCGAAVGPWAYLYSRWLLARKRTAF